MDAFDKVGLKPDAKIHLINGSLPCDFRKYTLFSGKHKEFKTQKSMVEGKKPAPKGEKMQGKGQRPKEASNRRQSNYRR
jgi:putative N6-adenine-specific DNA methylase